MSSIIFRTLMVFRHDEEMPSVVLSTLVSCLHVWLPYLVWRYEVVLALRGLSGSYLPYEFVSALQIRIGLTNQQHRLDFMQAWQAGGDS